MNVGQVLGLFKMASKGLLKKRSVPEYEAVTDITINGITYKTYWPIAPTSSNKVYGISFDPSTGEMVRIFSDYGSYSKQVYV